MNGLVQVALLGWMPLVVVLFAALPPRRAVLTAYLVGWLFLPVSDLQLFGFFDYSKATAVPLLVFAAVLAFDAASLRRLRFTRLDLPVVVFCVAPLLSSLDNGLGWYDALSGCMYQGITWGLPYLMGRAYFHSAQGLRQLALGVFAGGLVYVPLCLWEIRMSPQLHATLYGFQQHDWTQTLRMGGYRPMVFMQHGLMVGLWMGAASLVGLALWTTAGARRLWGMPIALLAPLVLLTGVLCKSFGATLLVLVGALSLFLMRRLRTSLPMAVLVLVPSTYVTVRTVAGWSGSEAAQLVREIDPERADSLAFRLDAEERLRLKAAEKPLFGWGGWGRSFVRRSDDPQQPDTVITDSLWILVFGKYGAVGLVALLALVGVPVLALWRRCPPRLWARPDAVLPWTLALVLSLYAIDCLVNAMENPIYLLIAGALSSSVAARPGASVRPGAGLRAARTRARSASPVPVR